MSTPVPSPSGAPSPLVSLVLAVKNAMPQVRRAMEALQRQTYRNFELIVQDGASTDDTVGYLRSLDGLPWVDIVSEPDSGIGQAYNRGLARSNGELVCFIAADEFLDDDALEKGVRWFQTHPDALVVFGGMRLVDSNGRVFQIFIPPPFDWIKIITNATAVAITAAFLNRDRIGPDLYYDESLRTCPDYDFWLRVASKHDAAQFVRVPEPIVTALADRTSMSFRAESFSQFTKDKLFVLNRFLDSRGSEPETAALRATASAGILTWAAENLLWLDGVSPEFVNLCREAARLDPYSARLSELARRSDVFEIDVSGHFTVKPPQQPESPAGSTQRVDDALKLDEIHSEAWWEGAAVERGATTLVTTGSMPWSYAALIPLAPGRNWERDVWYWVKIQVQVKEGEIGFSLFAENNILNERTISAQNGPVTVFLPLNHPQTTGVMIRNGSTHGSSIVEIFDASVESAPNSTLRLLR